jgi:phosphoglycerate dehydrogenase-like enzyme
MSEILVISKRAPVYAELIASAGIDALCFADVESALAHTAKAEILFGAPDLLAVVLPHCPNVRWVQSSWAGVKPLVECPRRDYLLTGVKDIFGPPMTEFVLSWLLAIERRIPERYRAQRWHNTPDGDVAGKTVGIMGTGSIGIAVARGCRFLGMTTRGLNTDGHRVEHFDECWPLAERLGFAGGLDYLVALLPDTPQTDDVIDAPLLAALKPGAVLINAGRGNAVRLDDLLAALASGALRHAVLDVLREEPLRADSPLWQVEGLSITSHTAAPTPERAIVNIFCDNYRRYRRGDPLHYVIDLIRGY